MNEKDRIEESIGECYKSTDDLLINELVDWIKISYKAKEDLQLSIKQNGAMSWQALTTISMCSKSILAIAKSLNITPLERNTMKQIDKKQELNLIEFLSER